MSIPNRTVSITDVFASDASTTIPEYPVSGASYRNTALSGTAIREGWAYKTIVDSADFNQALYEYSSVTAQVEKYGFLPWSNLTDYVEGSLCLGSNGTIYQAKQSTGPSSTAIDPTTDSTNTYWEDFVGSTYVTRSTAQTIPGNKTFSGANIFSGYNTFTLEPQIKMLNYKRGVTPSSDATQGINYVDNEGNYLGGVTQVAASNGYLYKVISQKNQAGTADAYFDFGFDGSGNEFADASAGVKRSIASWGVLDTTRGVAINAGTDYALPNDGIVIACAYNPSTGANASVIMDVKNSSGTTIFSAGNRFQAGSATQNYASVIIPLAKGMKVNTTFQNLSFYGFYPLKGA